MYTEHLSKDKKLKKLIEAHGGITLSKKKNMYHYLCASIISQQLSTKVAAIIYQRFVDLYNGLEPHPQQIMDTPYDTLRSIGLSHAKTNYIKNVADFELKEGMGLKKLQAMNDEEVINYLTQIKGVGRWTVEMLLMFALGREDVFAVDDLGIQQAIIQVYKLNIEDKKELKEKMLKLSSRWKPYRTYACLHLWRWKDNTPLKKNN